MAQRNKRDGDLHEQEIAQLEAKLARAYRTVKRLRQENQQLQEQLQLLNHHPRKLPSTNHSPKRPAKSRRSHAIPKSKSKAGKDNSLLKLMLILFHTGWVVVSSNLITRKRHRVKPSFESTKFSSPLQGKTKLKSRPTSLREPVKPKPAKRLKTQHLATITILIMATIGIVPRLNNQKSSSNLSSQPLASSSLKQANGEVIYNLRQAPQFTSSPQLQTVVDQLVNLATAKQLPTEDLSITLIDVKSGETAAYQQHVPRYPASVVKMFWMVALYGQLEVGNLSGQQIEQDLYKMTRHSDNNAASQLVDQITGTKSGDNLSSEELSNWIYQRQQVNRFFAQADYFGIDISHKTYPVSHLKHSEPTGRDKQMRLTGGKGEFRNQINTQQASRLMYEIVTQQAISPGASQQMSQWLKRNLQAEDPDYGGFNPIRGFFGQSLPPDTILLSKAGSTSDGRHEVAYIASPDGTKAYILAVFAEGETYSKHWKLFPQMSNLVYKYSTSTDSQSALSRNSHNYNRLLSPSQGTGNKEQG